MKKKRLEIKVVCVSCGGTGLYSGFMEKRNQAVVCTGCGGTGCETLVGQPFEGRKRKRGIKEVRFGSGLIIDSPTGWFSYEEFLKRVPEKPAARAKRKKVKK